MSVGVSLKDILNNSFSYNKNILSWLYERDTLIMIVSHWSSQRYIDFINFDKITYVTRCCH